jgi:CheY-like chemotaxis protein
MAMATILLVDDDSEVLDTLVAMVQAGGHNVLKAVDGRDALGILDRGEPVDLLLTDVMMPGLDGFLLARMAIMRRPSLKVLYLTGYWETPEIMHSAGKRFGDLLTKPIRPDDLRSAVTQALQAA